MITDTIIQQLVDHIKQFDPEKKILFGSYAYGNPAENSDNDLFVVKLGVLVTWWQKYLPQRL